MVNGTQALFAYCVCIREASEVPGSPIYLLSLEACPQPHSDLFGLWLLVLLLGSVLLRREAIVMIFADCLCMLMYAYLYCLLGS